jgi:YegS/Rv2252/BmrU family lipid kinase
VAGKGTAGRQRDAILDAIKSHTSDYIWEETNAPGDATQIARASASEVVIAVGGDGTIHEVANGLAGSAKALGIVPVGSGNDFIKNLGIPRDVRSAIALLLSGRPGQFVDLGHVVVDGRKSDGSYFVNGMGVGFDAEVAVRTQSIPYLSGTALYLAAVLQTLGKYRAPDFAITIDGVKSTSRRLLIAVGNGVCAGGGFYLTPDARIDDGKLDVCSIREKTVPSILRLMPSVMRGQHRSIPGVTLTSGEAILIEASKPVAVHADGEILGKAVRRLEIVVKAKALRVLSDGKQNRFPNNVCYVK